jgi:hypothetical protein
VTKSRPPAIVSRQSLQIRYQHDAPDHQGPDEQQSHHDRECTDAQSPNAELMDRYFVRVNVNVGRLDANQDIAASYGVPLKGVPALAVLDGDGKVVYAQNKEFSDMRHLDSSALTSFLNQWKP